MPDLPDEQLAQLLLYSYVSTEKAMEVEERPEAKLQLQDRERDLNKTFAVVQDARRVGTDPKVITDHAIECAIDTERWIEEFVAYLRQRSIRECCIKSRDLRGSMTRITMVQQLFAHKQLWHGVCNLLEAGVIGFADLSKKESRDPMTKIFLANIRWRHQSLLSFAPFADRTGGSSEREFILRKLELISDETKALTALSLEIRTETLNILNSSTQDGK